MPTSNSPSEKFRQLVLYVARKTEADPRCGRTKLNKILFYADFEAYRSLGASISGQLYQKLQFGPAPRRLLPEVEGMKRAGWCASASRSYNDYTVEKLFALQEPDLMHFSGPEIAIVDRVIDDLWELNATAVSDLSHRFPGWQAVDLGDDIPYETAFIGDPRPLSPDETLWAQDVVSEYLAAAEA